MFRVCRNLRWPVQRGQGGQANGENALQANVLLVCCNLRVLVWRDERGQMSNECTTNNSAHSETHQAMDARQATILIVLQPQGAYPVGKTGQVSDKCATSHRAHSVLQPQVACPKG